MNGVRNPEVVLVTGASAGVGRATVREFAKRGAHIGLVARGGDGMAGLEAARREVEELGGKAVIAPADVADPDQLDAAAAKVEETLGPIDVWVNVAMVTVMSPLQRMTAAEYKRVTDVTYLGQAYGTMAALRRMVPRNRGHIVLVGSALAYRGIPLQSAYCGAKHGIQGMADSLHAELIHDKSNVRLTMVQLPALNTPQFSWCRTKMPRKPQPVPPIYQPEVAAEAIYYAAHHKRRQIYVGMSTVLVIQLNKFVPWLGDRYLAKTGYQGQEYDGRVEPDRPDNLFQPVAGDHGARGAFDQRARGRSIELWLSTHRNVFAVAGIGAAALAALSVGLRSARA